MSICLITGDHPRHKFLVKELFQTGKISCWIVEKREKFVPEPPKNLKKDLMDLYIHHFNERERVEMEVFGESSNVYDLPTLEVSNSTLNSPEAIKFVMKHSPKMVISYGCHKISNKFIESIKGQFWNTHGGFSPDYRGVATHFWPSYFLEPQMTGMTLHETTDHLDGGRVILQTSAPLVKGDTLHRLAARNVEHYVFELRQRLTSLDLLKIPLGIEQKKYGKVFSSNDWRPDHLRMIYETYNDSIVDYVLDGRLDGREPELLSVILPIPQDPPHVEV
jgi:hypothetical protein